MPQAYFDNYAHGYDEHFSDSPVGKAQRNIVHAYLQKQVNKNSVVLEINCGTGEDALFLAPRCKEIICTDISSHMVNVTALKAGGAENCSVLQSSVQEIGRKVNKKADLVFSDFGGLNCLDKNELAAFSETSCGLTLKGSDLIFVIMGRKCLWEKLYFFLKGDFKKARRRRSTMGISIGTITEEFKIHYYSPREIGKIFDKNYTVAYKAPVGLFIPPSYLNPFFGKRMLLFSLLGRLDRVFSRFSFLSDYGDHYLIHLKRK